MDSLHRDRFVTLRNVATHFWNSQIALYGSEFATALLQNQIVAQCGSVEDTDLPLLTENGVDTAHEGDENEESSDSDSIEAHASPESQRNEVAHASGASEFKLKGM